MIVTLYAGYQSLEVSGNLREVWGKSGVGRMWKVINYDFQDVVVL